jgi:hypothetical protein
MVLLTNCEACIAAHGNTNLSSISVYVDPDFAQYINFCSAFNQTSTTITPVSAEIASIQSQIYSLQSVASLQHTSFSNLGQSEGQTSSNSFSSASAALGISISTIYATLSQYFQA